MDEGRMMPEKTWKIAERRVASRLKGQRIPVTGINRNEADVITPVAHCQIKHRKGVPQFLRGWVNGIAADAKPHGKVGIVVWSTPGARTDEALVVMRLDQFQELYGPLVGGEDEQRKDDGGQVAAAMELRDYFAAQDALVFVEPRHCPTCRHHTRDDRGDHWCALGISTAGRVRGLVTHLQPFGCSLHEGKETSDDE